MKSLNISHIEYPDKKHPHFLSIGNKAPWDNQIQFSVPKWFVLFIVKLFK